MHQWRLPSLLSLILLPWLNRIIRINCMLPMLVLLASRLSLLVLVSPQTHSTLFLVPVLGLVNAFIPKDALMLVALSDAPEGASQLLRRAEALPLG